MHPSRASILWISPALTRVGWSFFCIPSFGNIYHTRQSRWWPKKMCEGLVDWSGGVSRGGKLHGWYAPFTNISSGVIWTALKMMKPSCFCCNPTLWLISLRVFPWLYTVIQYYCSSVSGTQQEFMAETLPDHKAITVPVPTVNLATEDRFKALPVAEICHVVVQWVSL